MPYRVCVQDSLSDEDTGRGSGSESATFRGQAIDRRFYRLQCRSEQFVLLSSMSIRTETARTAFRCEFYLALLLLFPSSLEYTRTRMHRHRFPGISGFMCRLSGGSNDWCVRTDTATSYGCMCVLFLCPRLLVWSHDGICFKRLNVFGGLVLRPCLLGQPR